jgi:hypothetical protein
MSRKTPRERRRGNTGATRCVYPTGYGMIPLISNTINWIRENRMGELVLFIAAVVAVMLLARLLGGGSGYT